MSDGGMVPMIENTCGFGLLVDGILELQVLVLWLRVGLIWLGLGFGSAEKYLGPCPVRSDTVHAGPAYLGWRHQCWPWRCQRRKHSRCC